MRNIQYTSLLYHFITFLEQNSSDYFDNLMNLYELMINTDFQISAANQDIDSFNDLTSLYFSQNTTDHQRALMLEAMNFEFLAELYPQPQISMEPIYIRSAGTTAMRIQFLINLICHFDIESILEAQTISTSQTQVNDTSNTEPIAIASTSQSQNNDINHMGAVSKMRLNFWKGSPPDFWKTVLFCTESQLMQKQNQMSLILGAIRFELLRGLDLNLELAQTSQEQRSCILGGIHSILTHFYPGEEQILFRSLYDSAIDLAVIDQMFYEIMESPTFAWEFRNARLYGGGESILSCHFLNHNALKILFPTNDVPNNTPDSTFDSKEGCYAPNNTPDNSFNSDIICNTTNEEDKIISQTSNNTNIQSRTQQLDEDIINALNDLDAILDRYIATDNLATE